MASKMMCVFLGLTLLIIASNGAANNLEVEGSSTLVDCWNALIEIKSCSNEIILFLLNGQTDIGPECCRSIGIITRNCWPAMLTSIGFTAEEGNILRGYCDAASSTPIGPVAAPPPAAASPQ